MAYTRLRDKKTIATNLGTFIDTQLFLVRQQRQTMNLDKEAKFNQAVLDDNMTLEQQLEWRREQLREVAPGDREESRRIRSEISSLRDQIEQRDFNDEYVAQLTNMNDGMQSIDATINWLNTRLAGTTDPSIQTKIRGELNTMKANRFTLQQNMIKSNTDYAQNSQDVQIIGSQIDKVKAERTKALNAGLDEYVSVLDLQLQALSKSMTEATVQKSLTNMSVGTATGQSAAALLDAFNTEIEKADKNTPVTIGGQRYENSQQYWQIQRGQYLNDRSQNGFFPRYQSELQEQIEYRESKKLLSNNTMSEVQNWYGELNDRPELQDYQDRINTDKQKALQFTADKRANQIINNFSINLDTGKALADLAYIQDKFGVDQTNNYQRIITATANEKQAQTEQILGTMRSIMAENPGMSSADAMQAAIRAGAGMIITPEQYATTEAAKLIEETAKKGQENKGTTTSPLDVTPEETKAFQSNTDGLQEGSYYKDPNSSTVYKYEGGKMRPFTGNFTEEEFKMATGGSGFDSVQTAKNIASIPKGDAITKNMAQPETPTPTPTPKQPAQPASPATPPSVQPQQDTTVGEYIPDPGLLKNYSSDQIIRRGEQIFLKPGITPVWQKQLNTQEQKQYKEDQLIRTDKNVYLKR